MLLIFMKVFFLYLLIIVGDSYAAVKIPIGFTLGSITCEEAFYNNVEFVKNENHKQYEPLTYATYKNYHVFANIIVKKIKQQLLYGL